MKQTTESAEVLSKRQQEMEDHALALGGERFRKRLEKAITQGTEAQVGAAKKLLTEGLVKVEAAMEELLVRKTGRPHQATRWVKQLGSPAAAYLSLKVILDNIHSRVSMRRATQDLSDLITDELRFRRFKEKEPQQFDYAMTGFATSNYAHRARSLDARIRYNEVDVSDLQMTPGERYTVGGKLLDIVIEVTGLVEVERKSVRDGGKNVFLTDIVATKETLEWLQERNGALEYLWPVNLPMVMPPLPWAPGKRGGYRFGLRGKHQLVRSNNKAHKNQVNEAHIPAVYSALNRIQETPWCINVRVLEVMKALMNRGGDMAGLPPSSMEPLPPKPHDIDHNTAALKEWKKDATKTHDRNAENAIKRAELFRLLNVVEKVQEEAAIWFPHNLDFRGRVYPVTNYLHPQGDDQCKGLLQFADGKPLGRDGVAFLALHGCSSLGKTLAGGKLSHETLDARIEYILSITPAILEVAADPISNTWWMDADDRWQFLAFCFDWAGYMAYCEEGRGEEYVSCLPTSMDGTCNGLQHFAALWLDPVGGAAVNVVPQETPRDIYQTVANVVLERLEKENATKPYALLWLNSGLVDRSLTKRPTMTFGYGSQAFGFGEQLREYIEGHKEWRSRLKDLFSVMELNDKGEEVFKSKLQAACSYMARLIWEALEEVAVSAFAGMAWMRGVAKVISKTGSCVGWTVPGTGFPVRQGYMKQTQKQNVATVLAGQVFKPVMYTDTDKADWRKQSSAIAPNIVHSLDAAALMLTVNAAADSGIQHFAMVHDSYGTLAADAPLLAGCTRQAFLGLYAGKDVVNDLWNQFAAQVDTEALREAGVEVPVPPEKGNNGQVMDLSGVLLSDYFFS